MVKGKRSPILLAQKGADRQAGSRHQRRAAEKLEQQELVKKLKADLAGASIPQLKKLIRRKKGK